MLMFLRMVRVFVHNGVDNLMYVHVESGGDVVMIGVIISAVQVCVIIGS